MQIKLNFQVDKLTLNNRVYKYKTLANCLDAALKEKPQGVEITTECSGAEVYKLDQNKIAGFVTSYKIDGNGTVVLECNLVARHRPLYQNLVSSNIGFLTINGRGETTNEVIEDPFDLINFFFTREATIGVMNSHIKTEPVSDELKPQRVEPSSKE